MVYTSGLLPIDQAGEPIEGGMDEKIKAVLDNLFCILEAAGSTMRAVVKVHVYMTDLSHLDTFSNAWQAYTPTQPVMTAVQVAALPKGVDLQIDCMAHASELAATSTNAWAKNVRRPESRTKVRRLLARNSFRKAEAKENMHSALTSQRQQWAAQPFEGEPKSEYDLASEILSDIDRDKESVRKGEVSLRPRKQSSLPNVVPTTPDIPTDSFWQGDNGGAAE